MRRLARSLVAVVAILPAACGRTSPTEPVDAGSSPSAPVRAPSPAPESPTDVVVAESTVPVVRAFRHPGGSRPFARFEHPGPLDVPRVFLVRTLRDEWAEVYLPMRPNGATGWVRLDDVELSWHPYRIRIDLSQHRLRVFEGADRIVSERVAVGTGGTPTPTGTFFVTMLVDFPDDAGPYGPYAYGLSGYSEVLNTFAGGDGQIAIHGTNAPTSIGTDASHGCIRMDNRAITRLTEVLPLGTPVRIGD